jgi:effector-binding domain-containing protein
MSVITEPKLEHRNKKYYAAIRTAVPIPFGKFLQPLWNEVRDSLQSEGATPFGPAMIRYLTTDMSKKPDIDVGFLVPKQIAGNNRVTAGLLPAGRYAVLLYTGPYKGKGIFKATVALLDWAKANHITWNTSTRNKVEWWNGRTEIYLSDPDIETDPKKFQTELAFLVAEN